MCGFCRLQFIANARIPILKFESSYNISCDISINNLSGQMKSKMLFWINEIDGRFRDLVLLVKEWAKTHHINDSKSGSLNSYSLSLLVVFHLQNLEVEGEPWRSCKSCCRVTCGHGFVSWERPLVNLVDKGRLAPYTPLCLVPAILPPLREIYPGNMIDDLTGVRTVAEKRIEDICGVNINRIKSVKLRLINRSSLSELFVSFLAKFSHICSKASTQGVSPYAGQLEDIDSNMRWLPKTYALFVEDPFEQPANTARTVSSNQLQKISQAIQVTHGVLISANQNRTSLVSVLVGPHVSRLVLRTTDSTPLISQSASKRNGFKGHLEEKQTPLQTRHKSQNKTMEDKRQNGAVNGPTQASTSQNQKVWRPKSKTRVDQIGSNG
ncbi:hypothetical protein OROGR_011294 [Orobanche gracilis]